MTKELAPFKDRYMRILDEKARVDGEYMSDVKELLESGANALGVSRSVLRTALARYRRQEKEIEADKELEPAERDSLDTMSAALGLFAETPLGAAAMARTNPKPAKAAKGKKAAEPEPEGDEPEDGDNPQDDDGFE